MQGSLEILIELTKDMEFWEVPSSIKKYVTLIWKNYKDPVNRKFENATAAVLDGLQLSEEKSCAKSELELELLAYYSSFYY